MNDYVYLLHLGQFGMGVDDGRGLAMLGESGKVLETLEKAVAMG